METMRTSHIWHPATPDSWAGNLPDSSYPITSTLTITDRRHIFEHILKYAHGVNAVSHGLRTTICLHLEQPARRERV